MVRMLSTVRLPLLKLALVVCGALAASGCDNGGLLVVEHNGKQKPVQGPSVNEMSNGGTYASNGKYKLFYTLGQGTPNQGVSKNADKKLNGGIVGAAQ
jgi:hypothetical protein